MWTKTQIDYRPMGHPDMANRIAGEAHECGLIVCKLPDGWHIVHQASGYDLGSRTVQPSKIRARHVVKHIAGARDWHAPREAFNSCAGEAIYQRIKDIGCLT